MKSIIWMFRTRVCAFAVRQDAPNQPTAALRQAMTSWHASVVGGTDLLQTPLERKYPSKVYTHCQYSGTLPNLAAVQEEEKLEKEIAECTRKIAAAKAEFGGQQTVEQGEKSPLPPP